MSCALYAAIRSFTTASAFASGHRGISSSVDRYGRGATDS